MKRVALSFLLLPLAIPLLCAAQIPERGPDLTAKQNLAPVDFKAAVAPLLEKYCTDCHSGKEPKGDLNLEFADRGQVEQRLSSDHKLFEKMADRLAAGKMPPPKKAQPTVAERDLLLTWISRDLL